MKSDNVVQIKSYEFAVTIVKVCMAIQKEQKEFVLSKQLLRSGTSIGAISKRLLEGRVKKIFSQS